MSTRIHNRSLWPYAMALLGIGRTNPEGAIGVVGSGWSLTDRVAGLLDGRCVRTTRLIGRSKVAVGFLACVLSVVLFATVKFSERLAVAQQPPELAAVVSTASENDWIRGTGDNIEFRLRGRLIGGIDGNPVDPKIEVRDRQSSKLFQASIVGNSYEVWVPVKDIRWIYLSITGGCSDGRRAARSLGGSELRIAMVQGVDLTFQRVSRTVTFQVRHRGEKVAGAKLNVLTTVAVQPVLQTDAKGLVSVGLLAGESLSSVTVWTDTGLLGGFQFAQKPERDPNASEHIVDLLECENRMIHVVDTVGSPVEGVRLRLQVATPEPYYNYFGNPDGCEVVTDATGVAQYRWFPKLKDAHHYGELVDRAWVLQSQANTNDGVEIVVMPPAERVRYSFLVILRRAQ